MQNPVIPPSFLAEGREWVSEPRDSQESPGIYDDRSLQQFRNCCI
jgi:hypothetical protein